MLFDLIDQNDDGFISKKEFSDTFKYSFMQNLASDNKIDDVLRDLFGRNDKVSKKDVFNIVLKDQKLKNLFIAYSQTKQ